MQGLLSDTRERAIIQSVLKIEGNPQAFVGLQFQCRLPGKVGLERVEIIEAGEGGKGFRAKSVEGDEIYEGIEACQLTIGRGKQPGELLRRMLHQHGFETEPYLLRDEFRTPTSQSGSLSSGHRREAAGREGAGGFRPPRIDLSATGRGQDREGTQHLYANVRGAEEKWVQRGRQTPLGQPGFAEMGVGRESPFAPAAIRNPQIPFQANYGSGARFPGKNRYQQFMRGTQPRQTIPHQFTPPRMAERYEMHARGAGNNEQAFSQGPVGGAAMHDELPNVPEQGLPQQYGYQGQRAQEWVNPAVPMGFVGGGEQYGMASGGRERATSGAPGGQRGKRGESEMGGSTKEVMQRLASFEKKLNIQSSRTGIEAEMRRQQAD
jgi:hypothetical protein